MTQDITTLIQARIAAKRNEDQAATTRKAIDLQIAELFRPDIEGEGSTSQKFEGLAKVTVKFGTTRKVDTEKLQSDWVELSPEVQACFKFDAELKLPLFRDLPDAGKASVSDYVTSKPATPSVTVELI